MLYNSFINTVNSYIGISPDQPTKGGFIIKIIIIRHGKVKLTWPKKCSSEEFDRICGEYDLAGVEETKPAKVGQDCEIIYVSHLIRSVKTAQMLFPDKAYCRMDTIGEVPLRSFVDKDRELPLWMWNIMGRLQWYVNNRRQPEVRRQTRNRADAVISALEKDERDCVLVTHGFFMKTLLNRLKKRGYQIEGQKLLGFSNLQAVTVYDGRSDRED